MKTTLIRLIVAFAVLTASQNVALAETPVAKVGNRVITLEELQKSLNSTPYGMPKTNTIDPGSLDVMNKMLGELINAELLYDEAQSEKIRKTDEFRLEVAQHKKDLLSSLYREKVLEENVTDDPAIAEKYAKEKSVSMESAKALLRVEKRKRAVADESLRLFSRYSVHFSPLAARQPSTLKDRDMLVHATTFKIRFRDVKPLVQDMGSKKGLLDLLAQCVEVELFAARALETGMVKEKKYQTEMATFEKNLAVTLHRGNLEKKFKPTPNDIDAWIKKNEYLRFKPQKAEVLMIVVKTEAEASKLREEALKGGNFYEMAVNNSIAPNAQMNAGRVGPVTIGERPYNSVDNALLKLKPGEITPPLKGDKGYGIFKLLDISPREIQGGAEVRAQAEAQGRLKPAATVAYYFIGTLH
ncbi:MAG: peptidyl-prolyl cis-trans isomerase [Nitrospinae bacterium]|nr:peptidyl-prolyl cis-trans isomerase [Nitrospinota bacterium]